ncbi:nucleoside triphosphate pyrophosphohydrolase family protein [Catenulispora subtropica]|uniref:MazG nucleotide pyrophosphohydrolase n=1 Tax=Catenulispora subtropica TaxID=450798 RepID=A0ABN2R4N0_9ACTN
MDLRSYQQAALKTAQPTHDGHDALIVALLGLAGEVGGVATAYKKLLRDGPAYRGAKAKIREELGDVLWYIAAVADHFDLDLEDIAAANLGKIADRWKPSAAGQPFLDQEYPPGEQLPRTGVVTISLETNEGGRMEAHTYFDGQAIGDSLTDAAHIQDGYALHDVFHLAYAAVLGWSPVTRMLLGRKRRSVPTVDEAEDGGRAIAIEEGISALVFSYAVEHDYLEGVEHVDHELLQAIKVMVALLEVSAHRAADWEKAILEGFAAWRAVRAAGGGVLDLDMNNRSLRVRA